MNSNNNINNLHQINYKQIHMTENNAHSMIPSNTKSKFDVLCENCYDILGQPSGYDLYSEKLGYYNLKNGRLHSYFKKMDKKYGGEKLKNVMSFEEKKIYNRLCTCGRCGKCLSNYS